jgi:hypothetical protein
MAANVYFFWNNGTSFDTRDMSYVNTTPKTPRIGEDISNDTIRLIFGKGNEPTSPGLELDNYQGVEWWNPDYPHNKGKFNSTGAISYDDLHYKHGEDPIGPGIFVDRYGSVSAKTFVVPPYRQWIRFEIWGGGGSGGGSSYYTPYVDGNPGGSSTIFGITAGGGQAGKGGARVAAQSGSGGAGGIVTGSLNTVCEYFAANGYGGGNGEAVNGRGNVGGSSGNTASIMIEKDVYSSGIGGRRGGNGPSVGGLDITYPNSTPGLVPGGGGGSAGYSEFRSRDVSRAAGGAGGGGAYTSFYFNRSQMAVGNVISYTVGAGGPTNITTNNNTASSRGSPGANGVLKVTWV